MASNDLTFSQLLSIPYLVEAETVDLGGGNWVRRAAYPELPGCLVEAPTIEDALERLERRRVETLLEVVRSGARPPVPRQPLPDADPIGVVARLGFGSDIACLLDRPLSELGSPDYKTS